MRKHGTPFATFTKLTKNEIGHNFDGLRLMAKKNRLNHFCFADIIDAWLYAIMMSIIISLRQHIEILPQNPNLAIAHFLLSHVNASVRARVSNISTRYDNIQLNVHLKVWYTTPYRRSLVWSTLKSAADGYHTCMWIMQCIRLKPINANFAITL